MTMALQNAVQRDQATPFDLRNEAGWRVTVYRLNEGDHVLSIVMHISFRMVGLSIVLMHELATFYSALDPGRRSAVKVQPLPIQYSDFSLWQRQQAQIDEHQRQLRYWHTQLQTSRPAELLADKLRPSTLSGKADKQILHIGNILSAQVHEFCQAHGVTLFIALLAVFRVTHYRLTEARTTQPLAL